MYIYIHIVTFIHCKCYLYQLNKCNIVLYNIDFIVAKCIQVLLYNLFIVF